MNPSSCPHVDVVVVSYNGKHNLEYSLPSLVGQAYPSFNIFVADNSSTDGTGEWVRKYHPSVTVMRLAHNEGMSAMNHVLDWPRQGARTDAKYIFVAGWDLIFDPRCIEHAVKVMEADPGIGMVGFSVLGLLEWVDPGELAKASAALQETAIKDVTWVPGACSVIRREVLDLVGFLDPAYFAYCEEDDLQHRFRVLGRRTVLVNTPVWQNVREASFDTATAAYLAMRNVIRYRLKNFGMKAGLRQILSTVNQACNPLLKPDATNRVARRARPFSVVRNVPIVLKALSWNVLRFPDTLRARRELLARLEHARQLLERRREQANAGSPGSI